MPVIQFQGNSYLLDENENLLDGLLRHRVRVPFSCRAGVCHSCLLRVINRQGEPCQSPSHLLACQTVVQVDLSLALPTRDEMPGIITELTRLNATEIRIEVSLRLPFAVRSGEHVTLVCNEGFESVFAVSAISADSQTLSCVIKRVAGGCQFSAWIHSQAQTGDRLMVSRNV